MPTTVGLEGEGASFASVVALSIALAAGSVPSLRLSVRSVVAIILALALDRQLADMERVQNSRARNMNIKLMQQERRIEALEKKLEEPVADRTRNRKEARK